MQTFSKPCLVGPGRAQAACVVGRGACTSKIHFPVAITFVPTGATKHGSALPGGSQQGTRFTCNLQRVVHTLFAQNVENHIWCSVLTRMRSLDQEFVLRPLDHSHKLFLLWCDLQSWGLTDLVLFRKSQAGTDCIEKHLKLLKAHTVTEIL